MINLKISRVPDLLLSLLCYKTDVHRYNEYTGNGNIVKYHGITLQDEIQLYFWPHVFLVLSVYAPSKNASKAVMSCCSGVVIAPTGDPSICVIGRIFLPVLVMKTASAARRESNV